MTAGADVDWRWIEHLLICRAGPRCESCGRTFQPGVRELNIHHRRTRGMGGTRRTDVHSLANLLLLCAGHSRRLGGTLGCHGLVTTDPAAVRAEARGLVVHQAADPATVPVELWSGRRVLLDPDSPFYLPPADGGPEWQTTTETPHHTAQPTVRNLLR